VLNKQIEYFKQDRHFNPNVLYAKMTKYGYFLAWCEWFWAKKVL